jgi:hypothetical protein
MSSNLLIEVSPGPDPTVADVVNCAKDCPYCTGPETD